MDRQELERVANAYLGAWGVADWAQLQETLAPGVVFGEMTMQRQVEGRDAVVDALRQLQEQSPPVEVAPSGWLVDEANNMIATELFVRRLDRDVQPPMYATIFLAVADDRQISGIRALYQVVAVEDRLLGPICNS